MPYFVKEVRNGFKVCKKTDPERCFSKAPLAEDVAKKQMTAINISEHGGGEDELAGSGIILNAGLYTLGLIPFFRWSSPVFNFVPNPRLPSLKDMFEMTEESYITNLDDLDEDVNGFMLQERAETYKIYRKADVVVVAVRGTAGYKDVKAWTPVALGNVRSTERVDPDLHDIPLDLQEYKDDGCIIFGTGHSLAGVILDDLLKNGHLTQVVSFNPAVERQMLGNSNNIRFYMDGDPLLNIMGCRANNAIILAYQGTFDVLAGLFKPKIVDVDKHFITAFEGHLPSKYPTKIGIYTASDEAAALQKENVEGNKQSDDWEMVGGRAIALTEEEQEELRNLDIHRENIAHENAERIRVRNIARGWLDHPQFIIIRQQNAAIDRLAGQLFYALSIGQGVGEAIDDLDDAMHFYYGNGRRKLVGGITQETPEQRREREQMQREQEQLERDRRIQAGIDRQRADLARQADQDIQEIIAANNPRQMEMLRRAQEEHGANSIAVWRMFAREYDSSHSSGRGIVGGMEGQPPPRIWAFDNDHELTMDRTPRGLRNHQRLVDGDRIPAGLLARLTNADNIRRIIRFVATIVYHPAHGPVIDNTAQIAALEARLRVVDPPPPPPMRDPNDNPEFRAERDRMINENRSTRSIPQRKAESERDARLREQKEKREGPPRRGAGLTMVGGADMGASLGASLGGIKENVATPLDDSDIRHNLGANAKILKYNELAGINSLDELLPGRKSFCVILYLDSEQSGHWVAVTRNASGVYFFDSYGGAPDSQLRWVPEATRDSLGVDGNYLTTILRTATQPVYYNKHDYQSDKDGVATCGRWCCLFIKKGMNCEDFYYFIQQQERKYKLNGDMLVSKLMPYD
jgi:hypothetical protein